MKNKKMRSIYFDKHDMASFLDGAKICSIILMKPQPYGNEALKSGDSVLPEGWLRFVNKGIRYVWKENNSGFTPPIDFADYYLNETIYIRESPENPYCKNKKFILITKIDCKRINDLTDMEIARNGFIVDVNETSEEYHQRFKKFFFSNRHGNREDSNPWVWVYKFREVKNND